MLPKDIQKCYLALSIFIRDTYELYPDQVPEHRSRLDSDDVSITDMDELAPLLLSLEEEIGDPEWIKRVSQDVRNFTEVKWSFYEKRLPNKKTLALCKKLELSKAVIEKACEIVELFQACGVKVSSGKYLSDSFVAAWKLKDKEGFTARLCYLPSQGFLLQPTKKAGLQGFFDMDFDMFLLDNDVDTSEF